MAREVSLTQGKVAIVDDDDFENVSRFKWHLAKRKSGLFYAARNVIGEPKKYMHREIMNCKDMLMVDHINGNGLDNRKTNLRIVTSSQNQANKRRQSAGFTFKPRRKKPYLAQIQSDGKAIYLGYFSTAQEAHSAYIEAAHKLFGKFCSV